ncbi:MAG: hypothetical protein PHS19_03070 [Eubacteriales bacterium]|nr:hypothetical protein [Eubacteriales bacterium]
MNRNHFIEPDIEKCCNRALRLFLMESGVGKEGEKYERMRRDALRVRERISSRVNVKGVYSYYDEFTLKGQVLKVDGTEFRCTAFEQLDPKTLKGVFFYAVTAGEYHMDLEPIMDQLYADIWGTAFTDAMREEVMSFLGGMGKISDSFGPGFYGMDVSEMKKMTDFVDFESMGMKIRESGIITPLKSCSGILFSVTEEYKALNSACELCFGSRKTCSLCAMKTGSIPYETEQPV